MGSSGFDNYAETDADGRFAFRTMRGRSGGRLIDTGDAAFDAAVDLTDIEPRFPFAARRQAK
ncbi:MAG: hypothetical protein JSS81_19675 [Acidobacteria bacterium]|nr:hypothetical protein [Acidobacteriota bacterium]